MYSDNLIRSFQLQIYILLSVFQFFFCNELLLSLSNMFYKKCMWAGQIEITDPGQKEFKAV